MRKVHKNRLLKLAEHLEIGKRGHKSFRFSLLTNSTGNTCGTAGCAMGELPVLFPRIWKFTDSVIRLKKNTTAFYSTDVQAFFGLDNSEENHLFYPGLQRPSEYGGRVLGEKARPVSVAKNIRDFVANREAAATKETVSVFE
jgi:hypothetical protein